MNKYDVVIAGAGAAGLAAALESARLGLRTALVDGMGPGGLLMNGGVIDGCPGLTEGMSGPDLISRLTDQVMAFDVTMEFTEITGLLFRDGGPVIQTDSGELHSTAVVIATGGSHRQLGVPLEVELEGRGISHCAACDGALFAGQEAVVIGGGDHTLESALYLSDLCPRVTVLHRGSELRAADVLQRAIGARSNVDLVLGHVVDSFIGDTKLEEVAVRDVANGVESNISANGAFVCIGLVPATDAFADALKLDDERRIIVDLTLATSAPGVFAAGVARSESPDQLITALADGVTAARSAYSQLRGPSA